MPIYEYECTDCGHQFEIMRKVSAGPLTECPECGKDTLQKLISRVGFRLKGTGWYETDFKDKPADAKKKTGDTTGDDKKAADKKPDTGKKTDSGGSEGTKKSSATSDD